MNKRESTPQSAHYQEYYQRIVEVAEQEFNKHGIKAVTMDDIAHKLKMSKRTLYQIFTDKEQLLLAVTHKIIKHNDEQAELMLQENNNILDLLLIVLEHHLKQLKKITPIFFEEINRYPKVLQVFEENKKKRFHRIMSFLQKGVEQGCFREDIDFTLVTEFIQYNSQHYSQPILKGYTLVDVFVNFVIIYFRGCCTAKGIDMIDELLEKYRNHKI